MTSLSPSCLTLHLIIAHERPCRWCELSSIEWRLEGHSINWFTSRARNHITWCPAKLRNESLQTATSLNLRRFTVRPDVSMGIRNESAVD